MALAAPPRAHNRNESAAPKPRPCLKEDAVRLSKWWLLPLVLALGLALYIWLVMQWSYSIGERAGWVQKFSKRGWLCKTWEGELTLVSLPGSTPEKFLFTVWDEEAAEKVNAVMGKRVSLHYNEKVGLPTSCFGETRYFVTGVRVQDEIPISTGVVVQVPQPPASAASPAQ
jgi:hypothetical protein